MLFSNCIFTTLQNGKQCQTAPSVAVLSGSVLFVYAILSEILVYEILGHLLYKEK